jgi:hypothetical protein
LKPCELVQKLKWIKTQKHHGWGYLKSLHLSFVGEQMGYDLKEYRYKEKKTRTMKWRKSANDRSRRWKKRKRRKIERWKWEKLENLRKWIGMSMKRNRIKEEL